MLSEQRSAETLSQAASFSKPGQKSLLQEAVAEAVPWLAAEIPDSDCLGRQNLIAVRQLLMVLDWPSV